MSKNLALFITLITFLFSCKKDIVTPEPKDLKIEASSLTLQQLLIANEGNFQWGNAEITYVNLLTGEIIQDCYQTKNQTLLGDVCQSMQVFDKKIFIILNNSQKIIVLDQETLIKTGEISNLESPRYFLPLSKNKAYVTDLYGQGIHVVNPETLQKIKKINIPAWTESLLSKNGLTYVCSRNNHWLYIIDESTDLLTDSILIGYGSNSIQMDLDSNLWVLCHGDINKNEPAGLYQINTTSRAAHLTLSLPNQEIAWKMSINGSKNELFFIQKDIYRVRISQPSVADKVIPGDQKNYYGLKIHPENNYIFVGNARDYVQKGEVEVYDPSGVLKSTFPSGIIPGDFVFF